MAYKMSADKSFETELEKQVEMFPEEFATTEILRGIFEDGARWARAYTLQNEPAILELVEALKAEIKVAKHHGENPHISERALTVYEKLKG